MKKIVKVRFGNTEISAGSENEIVIRSGDVIAEPFATIAVKRDINGHVMQTMVLGTGCVITYQEVQA